MKPPLQGIRILEFEGIEQDPQGPAHNVDYWQFASGDYLETMKIEVLAGRGFEPGDARGSTPVALINKTMAETFWPGLDPVGRRVRPGDDAPYLPRGRELALRAAGGASARRRTAGVRGRHRQAQGHRTQRHARVGRGPTDPRRIDRNRCRRGGERRAKRAGPGVGALGGRVPVSPIAAACGPRVTLSGAKDLGAMAMRLRGARIVR